MNERGFVTVSMRELERIKIIAAVAEHRLKVVQAAERLDLCERQVSRLVRRYEASGPAGLVSGRRGQPSNRELPIDLRARAMALVRERYADFGPTLACEKLRECHGVVLAKETVRRWMRDAGLWIPRKQRPPKIHQPRNRRACLGELIQIDGSDHRWFEQRGEPCTLLVFIDDATSKLMQLRFVASESTASYFEALDGYLKAHGCPTAFYSDKHTVFRVGKQDAKGGSGMTQFGRALAELNIEILCANSSQAKGRVERANRTLQDRLVKELRLAGICDMSAGNVFLPEFVERFNEKFALPPAKAVDLHRKLNMQASRLADILCHRELRHVSQQLSLAYDRKQIILERSELADKLPGQYVELYDFTDRPLDVRWKSHSLPYRVFSKDQRVSHTAIVENKRLGHALAVVKALQDVKYQPKVMTNSEKTGYKKDPRRVYGPDFEPKSVNVDAVEMPI